MQKGEMWVSNNKTDLDKDFRLVRQASSPQNQGKNGKQHHKRQHEAHHIKPHDLNPVPRVVVVVLILIVGAVVGAALEALPSGGVVLETGGGETGGGGLAGVVNRGAMVVMVGRGPEGAGAVRHLLHVVL